MDLVLGDNPGLNLVPGDNPGLDLVPGDNPGLDFLLGDNQAFVGCWKLLIGATTRFPWLSSRLAIQKNKLLFFQPN